MRRILLDTNTLSDMVRDPTGTLSQRIRAWDRGKRITSVIVAAEIEFGLAKKPEATRLAQVMRALLDTVKVEPLPTKAAAHYGRFRAELERNALPVDSNDLFIAAHAAAIDAIVITRNLRHFKHLPGINAEDWT